MGDFVEFSFEDGTSVLLEVFQPPAGVSDTTEEGFPGAAAPISPVGRTHDVVTQAGQKLEEVLRPLVPVLGAVRSTVSRLSPDEVTVTLGVKLASNLQLGIVGGRGEANLTVAATWRHHRHQDDAHPAEADQEPDPLIEEPGTEPPDAAA
ncbi:CU044_2847 family protein [Streptacidiphilus cavernicola]|uniref:CU044_2847 family protein n=1 Tax=Streptacidiphilus cavernicola TaxID=3342716 RepID=A0ABV6VQC4_9ACTN